MFSVQFLVISCFLSYTPILASVVDSLNCIDETVRQKLLFLFQKHSKTLLRQCRNLKCFRGLHSGPSLPGREGDPPLLHSKTLDPPLAYLHFKVDIALSRRINTVIGYVVGPACVGELNTLFYYYYKFNCVYFTLDN